MPFTSVTGASSVIKPGVVTSSTRPSAPYVGQLIFETDTNRLAVYNGSSWIMLADSDTPPGLELVKTQTIGTAVSSVTVSNAFSSAYDNYKVMIVGGVGSTETQLNMSFTGVTSQYYSAGVYADYSTGSFGGSQVSNGNVWGRVGYTNTAPNSVVMNMDILGPFLTQSTYATSIFSRNAQYLGTVNHLLNSATSVTEMTITTGTGTITGGTIRIYGYRNS